MPLTTITVIFSGDVHLRLAIDDSADQQLNISRHASTMSLDLVSKIYLGALYSPITILF